jgi:hypothetical protein
MKALLRLYLCEQAGWVDVGAIETCVKGAIEICLNRALIEP